MGAFAGMRFLVTSFEDGGGRAGAEALLREQGGAVEADLPAPGVSARAMHTTQGSSRVLSGFLVLAGGTSFWRVEPACPSHAHTIASLVSAASHVCKAVLLLSYTQC